VDGAGIDTSAYRLRREGLTPLPEAALPGSPADAVELDAAAISVDAVDVAGLASLLDDAGFVGGTERLFSRALPGRRRTLARALVFETAQGAQLYLRCLPPTLKTS
jgi:hypothetical protein